MSRRPIKRKKKKFISRALRMQLLAWVALICPFMLISGTWAWYSLVEREAEGKETQVMKPYFLTLLKPGEQEVLELSVGSLMPGVTKQIVFCVSNKDNEEDINMGGSDFDYSMELVYTENLALNYEVYELVEVFPDENGNINSDIVTEGVTETENGATQEQLFYWNTKGDALVGEEVSALRHVEVELAQTVEEDIRAIINRGKYIEYTKNTEDEAFHLASDANESGYDSQYFVVEIEWDDTENSNFENYEKETDVIYLVVKALQPKPETISEGGNE